MSDTLLNIFIAYAVIRKHPRAWQAHLSFWTLRVSGSHSHYRFSKDDNNISAAVFDQPMENETEQVQTPSFQYNVENSPDVPNQSTVPDEPSEEVVVVSLSAEKIIEVEGNAQNLTSDPATTPYSSQAQDTVYKSNNTPTMYTTNCTT